MWGVTIMPDTYKGRSEMNFTRRYGDTWEGQDHKVSIVAKARPQTLVHRKHAV